MKKKIIARSLASALLCAGILCTAVGSGGGMIDARAETQAELEKKIKDNEAKIADYEAKIKALDGDIAESEEMQEYYLKKLASTKELIDTISNNIYLKEQEIADKEDEIAATELRIEETEKNIADKEVQMELLDKQNKDNIYRFGQIIRAMYITDSDNYMTVLVGSSDFYDIFVRSEIMKNISEQNIKFMNDLLNDIHTLESDKEQLENDKIKLEFDKKYLEEEKETLEGEYKELDEQRNYNQLVSANYTTEYNTIEAQIKDFEKKQAQYSYLKEVSMSEIQAYEAKIDEIIRQAQLAAKGTTVYDPNEEWWWPLEPQFTLITTYFGYDSWRKGNHGAIDVGNGGIGGHPIYASKGGEVIVAKTSYTPGYDYGMYVVIDHGGGYQTLYAHASAIYVSVGQIVKKGDTIAAVGSTGWSTGNHLHFEMRKDGVRVDPLSYVKIP